MGRAKLWQDALQIFASISKTRLAPKLEKTRVVKVVKEGGPILGGYVPSLVGMFIPTFTIKLNHSSR